MALAIPRVEEIIVSDFSYVYEFHSTQARQDILLHWSLLELVLYSS